MEKDFDVTSVLAIWKLKAEHEFGSMAAIPVAPRGRGAVLQWTLMSPSHVEDGLCLVRPVPHTMPGDLMALLPELREIQTWWGDFSMAVSSPFLFSFLSWLHPWGERTSSPTCTAERNKWHKNDLHCEMCYDEGLARLIWSGCFATLSRQNHKYPKDRVSSLALSSLGLSKLHAITLINYFSLLIPVCLHEADNKIRAEGAARWDKIEAWTFFKLTRLLCVIWGDNMLFPLVANETEASEIARLGECAQPQPRSFCNCLGQAEHPSRGHLCSLVGNQGRYTHRLI